MQWFCRSGSVLILVEITERFVPHQKRVGYDSLPMIETGVMCGGWAWEEWGEMDLLVT